MTNAELARLLNISPAALSLIINNKPGVSDATRERVLSQLEEMGLSSRIKKAPTAAVSNNLCFIIYKRHGEILDLHPFFLLLIENVETHARSYGYNILLSTIDKRKPMEPQIEHLHTLNCQGAVIFGTEMQDEDMDAFLSLHIPLVVMDNDLTRLPCNTISINNQMGTYQAIDHLIQMGHTRIGYLKSQIRINSFKERHQGYANALTHFGLAFQPEHILSVHYTEEGSYRDLIQYLENHTPGELPDAFVCDDDTIAVGALRAFKEKGIRVPDDISVIGFNDRPTCEETFPPLTSINVSKRSLAFEAVEELIRLIKNQEQVNKQEQTNRQDPANEETRSRKIRIGTKLIIRDSVSHHLS